MSEPVATAFLGVRPDPSARSEPLRRVCSPCWERSVTQVDFPKPAVLQNKVRNRVEGPGKACKGDSPGRCISFGVERDSTSLHVRLQLGASDLVFPDLRGLE